MKIKLSNINKLFVCFGICFLFAVTNSIAQISYIIVPGVRVGAITKNISESELKRIYGSKNVKSDLIGLGEGETMPGTVIYPNDPKKRIEIVWKNNKMKRSPDFIQIYGDKSLWKTKEGISLGTSLKKLERHNGKSFTLAGFEWDYSGTVFSWKSGKLAKKFGNEGGKVTLRLAPKDYGKAFEKDLNSVAGDGEFSSGNKAMQRINPRIYFMIMSFQ
jgi:hypothetical protein